MNITITPEVREAHETLSPCNVAFLEYAKKNPGCFRRSQFPELIEWRHFSTAAKLHPWPLFVSRHTRKELADASVKVFELIKSIPRRMFSDDPLRMSRYYGFSDEYVSRCLDSTSDKQIESLLARGDFIFSKSGLKCLEYNISTALGGWWLPIWEALYLKNPLISRFIDSHKLKVINENLMAVIFDHFIETSREYFPNEDEINLVILVRDIRAAGPIADTESYFNRVYKGCLQQKRLKGEARFGSFDQFTITGQYLYYRDKKIHAILDYCLGDVPVELVTLFKRGNLLILDGPVSKIMSNKLKLALLSEHEDSDLFTPGERETIKRYIPWTRKVVESSTTYKGEKIILKDFMISHREKLVLKPADGKGGENVYVGCHTPGIHWEKLVSEAFRGGPWVVQERVESLPFLLQWGEDGCIEHDMAWGLFVTGDRYGGVLLRVAPRQDSNGVINTKQGAWSSLVFDVDE